MAKLNILRLGHLAPAHATQLKTHEGAPARAISPEQALRRSVLACMLWEDQFYEDGVEIAEPHPRACSQGRVSEGCCASGRGSRRDEAPSRAACCWCARWRAIRPIVRLVARTLPRVIQRADELAEFVAIYWKEAAAAVRRR